MDNIDNIMQLCRLCLVKDQVNVPIFGGTNDIEEISSKISSCLPVKVSPDDSLPKKICDDCSYKLDLLYVFRNTSINSEKQLYQWLEQAGISKTTSGTISTTQSLTTPILATDSTIPSVPISTLDTVINDTITKSEISVKQEKTESTAGSELSAETQEYLLQQQKLPYQENFGDFNTTGTNSATAETEEPARKKPRRAAASKPPIKDNESDPDVPPTKAEDDSDEDIDDAGDGGGMDDDDDEEEEEEDDGLDHPEFVDVPSTSAEEQPGPSGVNKDPIAAPVGNEYHEAQNLLTQFQLYSCNICQKLFKGKRTLYYHKSVHSSVKYECNICGKKLKSFSMLKIHRLRHLKQYKCTCEICGYGCMFNSELKSHITDVHITDRKYSICDICGQSFRTRRLKSHMKRHEDGYKERPNFQCKFCTKTFSEISYLKGHIDRMHNNNRRKYGCSICNKQFASTSSLSVHKRLHTGVRTIGCTVCDKKFTRKDALLEHIRTHTGEKPYICHICGRAFSQRTPLNNHLRQHTGEKPYSCEICDSKFVTKSTLTVHVKQKHQIN